MADIHLTAIVSQKARIGSRVSIGPYAVIGDATIGDDVVIHSHVVIGPGVTLGAGVEVFPGAFIGREPKGAGATSRPIDFSPEIEIGAGSSIGPHAIIYYDVVIGIDLLIGDGASIREKCRIGARCLISRYVTINYNTIIGDGVKVMDLTHLTGNMRIEDNAFVSTMVATANDNLLRSGFGEHIIGPHIEAGAVIGLGAMLLPGIRIGADATVAGGALVSRDVAPGETVMGVPARPVVR